MKKAYFYSIIVSIVAANFITPLHANIFKKNFPTTIRPEAFFVNLIKTKRLIKNQLAQSEQWIHENGLKKNETAPFVQALIVPDGSTLIAMGDIHGDHESLFVNLIDLRKKGYINEKLELKKDCYLIFTGDYADRGYEDVKVWHTLFKLKLENPSRVFLIRGNHEDAWMAKLYGFKENLFEYFHLQKCYREEVKLIWNNMITIFDILPQALFVGTYTKKSKFLMFCHGGIGGYVNEKTGRETLFNPSDIISQIKLHAQLQIFEGNNKQDETWVFQKLTTKEKKHNRLAQFFNALLSGNTTNYPPTNGFLWNDFITTLQDETNGSYVSERFPFCRVHSHTFAKQYLKKHNLYAIIRGHQHIPGGIVQLKEHMSFDAGSSESSDSESSDDDSLPIFKPDPDADFLPDFKPDPELIAEVGRYDSWIPLPGRKQSKIKKFSVFTCTTTPTVFEHNDNKSAYAIIKSEKNKWYLTPQYNYLLHYFGASN